MAQPVAHRYGKDAVSVYRIEGDRLFACEVRLLAESAALETSYTEGDNSLVVATDSMKNFIHRTALDFDGTGVDEFLDEVGRRFAGRYEHIETIYLDARELAFARRNGLVLQRLYDDVAVSELVLGRETRTERSGLEGLHLVKLAGSSFAGFVRDEYTTLPDSTDRPLFIHLDAHWSPRAPHDEMRETFVGAFAELHSESIQHLVNEMGARALDRFPQISEISFVAHNRLWDNAQEAEGVRVFTDARPPFGVIELTLAR
jgi:urate oxidase/2-oxo-4-hydroxy-4-carboxy-5-ureidoimidazoline decarboxylase